MPPFLENSNTRFDSWSLPRAEDSYKVGALLSSWILCREVLCHRVSLFVAVRKHPTLFVLFRLPQFLQQLPANVTMLSYENSSQILGNRSHNLSSFPTTASMPSPAIERSSGDHLTNSSLKHEAEIRGHPNTEHRHIWLITGPAGCGKSTVAEYVAKSLQLPFLEGDNVSTDHSLTSQSHF